MQTTDNLKKLDSKNPAPALIDAVRIDHGPAALLGRVFLSADELARQAGLHLSLTTLADLASAHRVNVSSWGPLVPALDDNYCAIASDVAFCLTCSNQDGTVVATQAERFYDLRDGTLATAITDGTLFGPRRWPQASQDWCTTRAPSAARLRGRLSYSGAIWVHPNYRQLRLAHVLLRASRALAYTRWATQFNIGLIKADSEGSSVHHRYGYAHSEHDFCFYSDGRKVYDGILLWMSDAEMEADFTYFVEQMAPELASRNATRGVQKQLHAG